MARTGVTLAYVSDAVGAQLPPGSLCWPTLDAFRGAFDAVGPRVFQWEKHGYRAARRRWQQAKLDQLCAGRLPSSPDRPLFMYEVTFADSVGGFGAITAKVRFRITHSVYGLAEVADNGTRIWPSELPGSIHPRNASLIVHGVAIRGSCVTRLTSTFDDWTETLPLESHIERIDYGSTGQGWRSHFEASPEVPGLWIETPPVWAGSGRERGAN